MIDDEITMSKCSIDSTKTNVFMNNFVEKKKLEFGVNKCHKMHIGPTTKTCEKIRVHDKLGEHVDNDKYVGDILSNDGTNAKKIKDRCDKGFSSINEIISILEELPLGPYRIIAGLKLRESNFLSRLIFNSESWYNLKEIEIEKLSQLGTRQLNWKNLVPG